LQCLKNLRNYLCWMDTISGSRFVALSENVPFILRQVHAMPSSILRDYLRHEHVMVVGGALSSHLRMTDAETNSSRLSESRPFPTPPVWKWSGGFCSVVKDCVCAVVGT
jgi:hypothetical protein